MTKVLWNHVKTRISDTDFQRLKIPVIIPKNIPLSGKLHCNLIEIVYAVEVHQAIYHVIDQVTNCFIFIFENSPVAIRRFWIIFKKSGFKYSNTDWKRPVKVNEAYNRIS